MTSSDKGVDTVQRQSGETGQTQTKVTSGTHPNKQRSRLMMASTVGTILEWYDFNLYGLAAALVFGPLMFGSSSVAGTLGSFATLGVGFFARPIGGLILGNLGDRIGRKPVLMASFITMGISSALIGVLPTYAQIGIMSPVLLLVLRIVSGFAVGGEFAGASLLTIESAPTKNRGLRGAMPSMGTGAGFVLATVVFALFSLLPEDAFLTWGWRIPFLLGLILAVFGTIVRRHLEDTPAFTEVQKQNKTVKFPLKRVVVEYRGAILRIIGVTMGVSVWGYLIQTFVLSYGTSDLNLDKTSLLWAIGVAAGLEIVTIPFWGWLSDRLGRKQVMIGGVILTIIYVFPFFVLLQTGNMALVWLAIIVGLPILKDAIFGPMAALVAEMFDSALRYSGVSMGREIGTALFGGTAALIGTALIAVADGAVWLLCLYVILSMLVTGVAVLVGSDNSKKDLASIDSTSLTRSGAAHYR
jgi:MHS family shikimate/dehydroshikimate transporter-like MFS transporter